jgi:plasmid stability protein
MDTTIRNLDPKTYRALKARAALLGKTVGAAVNEAIQAYLAQPANRSRRGSVRDLVPEAYDAGNERLSEEIDTIVYGPGSTR